MQHFTKSLLATAILFGLTACGSSGGDGGSGEPTTRVTKAEIKPATTIKDIEKLSGTATYSAVLDKSQSSVKGDPRSGTLNFKADFNKKNISGLLDSDNSKDYDYRVRRRCNEFVGSGCRVVATIAAQGNFARAVLKETTLTNENGILHFNGKVDGNLWENGKDNEIVGTYQGQISGENAENISGSLEASSPTDLRFGGVKGVFNGKKTSEEKATISVPVVENQNNKTETVSTEMNKPATNTTPTANGDTAASVKPIVKNWDTLPAIPKLESSTSSGGHTSNITGKATYFTQKRSVTLNNNGKSYHAKLTPNTYAVLNADFDAKKVSGSAVTEFYNNNEKVAQSQIDFKETNLYRNGNYNLDFTGVSEGKIQVVGQDVQNATGSYDGSIDISNNKATIKHELYSDNDRSLNIEDTMKYSGEELKKQ